MVKRRGNDKRKGKRKKMYERGKGKRMITCMHACRPKKRQGCREGGRGVGVEGGRGEGRREEEGRRVRERVEGGERENERKEDKGKGRREKISVYENGHASFLLFPIQGNPSI